MIREHDKILHIGVISTVGTCNKALLVQQKYKIKHPTKQHHHNNKKSKGPKPFHSTAMTYGSNPLEVTQGNIVI